MKTFPILIPHFRAEEKLKKCIAHIEAQNYHPVEIFVRDNSVDNILFTAAINEGLYKYAFRDDVDYVLVLNQDAYLGADTLEKLVHCMQANPDCGIACPIQLNDDNSVNWGGSRQVFPFGVHQCDPLSSYQDDFETFWSNGAAMLIRTKLVKEIGVFDKNMRFICSDSDYAFTARARGWKVMVAAQARVRHATGESGASNNEFINQIKCEDAAYFYKKWLSHDIFKDLAFEGKVITESDIAIARRYMSGLALSWDPSVPRPSLETVDAIIQSGRRFMETGFTDLAKYSFEYLLSLDPNSVEAYASLGRTMFALKQYDNAVDHFTKATALDGSNAVLHFDLANSHRFNQNPERALNFYQKALALNPNFSEAYVNQGVLLNDLQGYESAIASLDAALSIEKNRADYWLNRGSVHQSHNNTEAAIADYDQAIALEPSNPQAYWNKAVSLLLEGQFAQGWTFFESRKLVPALNVGVRTFPQLEWDGKASLNDKTIFLYSEQGYGDTVQFARFAKTLAGQGAKVVLGVQPELVNILSSMSADFGFVVDGDALPHFDYHCALLSLPGLLGVDASNIPFSDRYLSSHPAALAAWRKRLGPATHPRVGLVWKGNATHSNDKNRSIALADLLPNLPEGIEYVCLQKEISQSEALLLSQRQDILCFEPDIHSFSDTAALCQIVDLVVSVDTSVAHLSAAMGMRTIILLPFNQDWRWLLNRTDSPWYQSVEIIRQARARDWSSVFVKLKVSLASLVQTKN
jgi:GT2 family glycosyltransferase/Tfp pilus assembly protein PilF